MKPDEKKTEKDSRIKKLNWRIRARGIVLVYAIAATLWIYFSDKVLSMLVEDQQTLIRISVYKGWGFVTVTSLLLYFLLRQNFRAIARSYDSLQIKQKEVQRLSCLYAALSQINQAIVWNNSRQELFDKICQALVVHGKFRSCWISRHNPETRQLEMEAEFGDVEGYLKSIRIYADERREGQGPVGRAFRENQPVVCNDYLNDPHTQPWHEKAREKNIRAGAAFPIRFQGTVFGTLNVYASEVDFFQTAEVELLAEAAGDISFALENLHREEKRKETQLALEKSEYRHRYTLDNILEGCQIIDFNWRYLYLNDVATRHNRRPNSEILGRTMHEAWPGIEDTRVFALVRRGMEERMVQHEEIQFTFSDGYVGWYDVRVQPVDEGILLLSIDITEGREAEFRLAESERKYRELVEYANSIILRWDYQGTITLMNEFGLRFFGYTADELIGQNIIGTIVPPEESTGRDLRKLMDTISANPEVFERSVNENMRRNGERAWIAWTNRIVRNNKGQITEILSVGTDVTEQRKAEQAIRDLNTTLEQRVAERTLELKAALGRAEAADRIKSAFLATMSHELRTPLNSIIGFTGIILQELAGPLNPEQTKQLGMVRSSAHHLLDLINDVLDISKIEAGQLEVHTDVLDLSSSLHHVISMVKPLADKKQLKLTADIPGELPPMLSDRRRIEQILINLLNNAIKFTPAGEVTLTAKLTHSFRPNGRTAPVRAVSLSVKDTGIGIKPEDLDLLFVPFRQLDTGLTRQHDGTGLGLAICKRLTELLGGEISARSEWKKGSEFIAVLPMIAPPGSPQNSPKTEL